MSLTATLKSRAEGWVVILDNTSWSRSFAVTSSIEGAGDVMTNSAFAIKLANDVSDISSPGGKGTGVQDDVKVWSRGIGRSRGVNRGTSIGFG